MADGQLKRDVSSSHPGADIDGPALLWIDDELAPANIEIRYLQRQGYRVDYAVTGSNGLALARAGGYDGILLDLHLPDIPGLSVLATLRAENISTPVLVVTGFGDSESARVAGRFGANEFRAKPIFIDELELAVERLTRGPASEAPGSLKAAGMGDELSLGFTAVARLLEHLHHLSKPDLSSARQFDSYSTIAVELVSALANRALPMVAFLACAAALRRAMAVEGEPLYQQVGHAQESIVAALARPGLRDPRVVAAIDATRVAAANQTRLTMEKIAESKNVSPEHLGRLVKQQTGFEFTEWRTAFILRPSVAALLETNEDVKQIVGGRLDFKHVSQFDTEFHRFFGLTPTRFRQIRRQRE
jgi:CheY-like chemotaxis protein